MSDAAAPAGDPVTVRTSKGIVRGVSRPGSMAFYGIPFAEPPAGTAAWDAPRPRAAWVGVRDARQPGPTPQRRPFMDVTTVPEPSIPGEDTLSVNVFTPTPDAATALPVLVWFHGGGYIAGSPSSPWYDGSAFCRDGIVVVAVSYRLGVVGFGEVEGAASNRAVRDWIAALEWVRDEIGEFGGDPGRVTIAGQSAGGGAVTTLLGIPEAQSLFHRAIAQSPAIGLVEPATARATSERIAAELGSPATRKALSPLDEDTVLDAQHAVLAAASTLENHVASAFSTSRAAGTDFGPIRDAGLVPYDAEEAAEHGVGIDKPLLIGATAHEFNMTAWGSGPRLEQDSAVDFLTAHGIVRDAAEAYAEANALETAQDALGQLTTDTTFRNRVDAFARLRRTAGTWVYDFRWRSPNLGIAMHCMELPFVWDLIDAPAVSAIVGDTPPRELAERMHGAWVAFVRDGDPGWPPFTPAQPVGQVFDDEIRVVHDPFADARLVRPGLEGMTVGSAATE